MKILYFAWLRERLDRGEDNLELPGNVHTIADLIDHLSAIDEGAALAFDNRKIIRAAIDEELVNHDAPIAGARTIAFFPPMTGG